MPYRLATAQYIRQTYNTHASIVAKAINAAMLSTTSDTGPRANGGTQTPDLLITNQLLYRLSYISAVRNKEVLYDNVTRREI